MSHLRCVAMGNHGKYALHTGANLKASKTMQFPLVQTTIWISRSYEVILAMLSSMYGQQSK